jgi:hypothetical protein
MSPGSTTSRSDVQSVTRGKSNDFGLLIAENPAVRHEAAELGRAVVRASNRNSMPAQAMQPHRVTLRPFVRAIREIPLKAVGPPNPVPIPDRSEEQVSSSHWCARQRRGTLANPLTKLFLSSTRFSGSDKICAMRFRRRRRKPYQPVRDLFPCSRLRALRSSFLRRARIVPANPLSVDCPRLCGKAFSAMGHPQTDGCFQNTRVQSRPASAQTTVLRVPGPVRFVSGASGLHWRTPESMQFPTLRKTAATMSLMRLRATLCPT